MERRAVQGDGFAEGAAPASLPDVGLLGQGTRRSRHAPAPRPDGHSAGQGQRGCYGQPTGAVPDALYPTPRMLSLQEIELVVTYLRARVIGKRTVTPEECAYYYGDLADTFCDKDK